MLKRLEMRSLGLVSPCKFANQEASRISSTVERWRVDRFPKNHKGTITSLDVDCVYGQFLLAGAADGIVRIHNIHHPTMETSSKFKRRAAKHRHSSLKFSHEGVECIQWYPRTIALFTSSGTDGAIKMWDVNEMRAIQSFYPCTTHKARLFQHHQSVVAKSPLVAASSSDGLIPLVDLRFGSTAHRLRGHAGPVLVCKWSSTDENLLASAGADAAIRLWDVRHTQKPVTFLDMHHSEVLNKPQARRAAHGGLVNSLQFTSDGCRLISFGKDSMVRVWDVYGGKPFTLNCGKIKNSILRHIELAVTHNASPQRMFVPSGRFVYIIDVESGNIISTLKGHNSDVVGVIYNPLYEELYSGGKDRELMVWRPHQEQTEAIAERAQKIRHTHSL